MKDSFLKKVIPYYLFYCILNFLFDVALISLVSFFHFILEHKIAEVEEWLSLNSWEILIISKLLSFSLTTLFLDSRIYHESPFKTFLKKNLKWPGRPLLISCIGFWSLVSIFGEFNETDPILRSNYKMFISYLGTFLFYILDYILIGYLCSVFVHFKKWDRLVSLFLFPIIFQIFTFFKAVYIQNITLIVFVHFFTMFIFRYNNLKRWLGGAIYVLIIIAPMSLILSQDILWAEKVALYRLENINLIFLSLFPVLWGYLFLSMKKRKLLVH